MSMLREAWDTVVLNRFPVTDADYEALIAQELASAENVRAIQEDSGVRLAAPVTLSRSKRQSRKAVREKEWWTWQVAEWTSARAVDSVAAEEVDGVRKEGRASRTGIPWPGR